MLKLQTQARKDFGKKVKQLRANGYLPAVLYGQGQVAEYCQLEAPEFKKVFRQAGESTVINLKLDNKDYEVLIYQVDYNPVTDEPIHVDFYKVEKGKMVEVDVPLVFVGESPAVKEQGATLVKVIHELPVKAFPKDLPHEIEVDISVLDKVNDPITVADLKLPSGVEAIIPVEETIILAGQAGEEVTEEDEAQPDLENVEVEKKGKDEEEEDKTETKEETN
ncbi:MAG: 50S ribosomal protein L25 [Patescibacteria group bacterium]